MKVQSAVCILLIVMLSGCIGGDDAPEVESGGEEEPDRNADGGSLTGQVMGEWNLAPLDVTVRLIQNEELLLEETTDEEGRYAFYDLEPGRYRVVINDACCKDFVEVVEVQAGKETSVSPLLQQVRAELPFMEPDRWNGFIGCAVHVWGAGGNNSLCDDIDPNADRVHTFTVDEGIHTIVFAMDWDAELSTISFLSTDAAMRIQLKHAETGDPYGSMDGEAPLEVRIGPETGPEDFQFHNITSETELMFEVWSSGGWGGFTYQQDFTVYYDLYYWKAPPEGTSALPDG